MSPEEERIGHGYPNCDCDLVGGDVECTIQPPYQSHHQRVIDLLRQIRDSQSHEHHLEVSGYRYSNGIQILACNWCKEVDALISSESSTESDRRKSRL